jgi:hypothetical protein
MAVPKWKFVLTDLQGNSIGEVQNASNRQVVLPLNRVPTASFQIPIQNALSTYFLDPTFDGNLKAYRNNVLQFHGPVVSSAEAFDSSSGQIVAVNAAGALWRLGYRLLGTTSAGWSLGNAGTTYDLGYIAQQMLVTANGSAWTGITGGTNRTTSNGAAGVFYFQDVLTCIAQLAIGFNSFDFEVAPTEPTNVSQPFPQIGVFNTGGSGVITGIIGQQRPNAIYEYGTTSANVTTYSRQIDRSNFCTKAYIQNPAASNYSGILTSVDAAAETLRGRYEALVDDGGVSWDVLRQALADYAVAIRKNARQVVQFTPRQNDSPSPLDDYIVGDQVRCRISIEGINILDAFLRVWGITFDIDNEGNEQPTLELVDPN